MGFLYGLRGPSLMLFRIVLVSFGLCSVVSCLSHVSGVESCRWNTETLSLTRAGVCV